MRALSVRALATRPELSTDETVSVSAFISAVHDIDVKVSVPSNPNYRVVVLGKIVVWSLTIATNVLATLLVAWKAWSVICLIFNITIAETE